MNKPVCLVTGAGGRLGHFLCSELLKTHHVIAGYRSEPPKLPSQLQWSADNLSTAKSPPTQDRSVYCIQADLTRREDVRRLVEVSVARFGEIDAMINVAADVTFHGPLLELFDSDDYASRQLMINCVAPSMLISAVYQHCWKDDSDQNALRNRSVLNISCMAGLYAFSNTSQAFYAASKAALNMLTAYLSLELAPYSVRANALCLCRASGACSLTGIVKSVRELLSGSTTGAIVPQG